MGYARRVSVFVTYDGKDISEDIAPFLLSCQYNDVMSGEADDINLTLEDVKELWEGDWLPEKGATLEASLVTQNWNAEGETKELPLGLFEIDEIRYSGPPHAVQLKAVSVPNNNELRGIERSRSWEKVKLSVVAKDIADGAGMDLFFDVPDEEDPEQDRFEQTEESDLAFLHRVTNDAGLALKIADNSIIIFDEDKYEEQEPVMTLTRNASNIKSYDIASKTRDVYAACRVKYTNDQTGETVEYTYRPDEEKKGKTLLLNQQVKDYAEAEKLAKKELRKKNKEEVTVSLSLMGNPDVFAANTVTLAGFHTFDGKYIITKATHSVGNSYETKVDLRRCLE